MTSLVALATKDAVVLGCDSLGTTTKYLIDPIDLLGFFDSEKKFELKKNKDGKPVLKDFRGAFQKAKPVPYTHMTHMTKLFSLCPLEMGIMSTGIASIGDRTIKSLIEEFKRKELSLQGFADYTVKDIADRILTFISQYFEKQYPDEKKVRPNLEFILGGYDKKSPIPEIVKIKLPEKQVEEALREIKFGIVFGGQMKEIQRIVFGTDDWNRLKIYFRHIELLRKYGDKINAFLKQKDLSVEIPKLSVDEINKEFDMFSDGWSLDGFIADWGDFSEQNAIECVDFFVNIMIKSQQFSEGMPTVGGEVHIALITKEKGFRFISKEEYHHEGHFVPKEKENI